MMCHLTGSGRRVNGHTFEDAQFTIYLAEDKQGRPQLSSEKIREFFEKCEKVFRECDFKPAAGPRSNAQTVSDFFSFRFSGIEETGTYLKEHESPNFNPYNFPCPYEKLLKEAYVFDSKEQLRRSSGKKGINSFLVGVNLFAAMNSVLKLRADEFSFSEKKFRKIKYFYSIISERVTDAEKRQDCFVVGYVMFMFLNQRISENKFYPFTIRQCAKEHFQQHSLFKNIFLLDGKTLGYSQNYFIINWKSSGNPEFGQCEFLLLRACLYPIITQNYSREMWFNFCQAFFDIVKNYVKEMRSHLESGCPESKKYFVYDMLSSLSISYLEKYFKRGLKLHGSELNQNSAVQFFSMMSKFSNREDWQSDYMKLMENTRESKDMRKLSKLLFKDIVSNHKKNQLGESKYSLFEENPGNEVCEPSSKGKNYSGFYSL